MGSIKNDDRSDETIRREENAIDRLMAANPGMTFDAAYDQVLVEARERRRKAAVRREERRANTLFGDMRK